VYDQFERVWKEVIMAYFKALSKSMCLERGCEEKYKGYQAG
jgi:hypothetical protein